MASTWTAGIVCEYNPFHNGHAWMIEELRRRGAGTVVCVMSGNFVQRAEPAILGEGVRADAALAAGADLVLRLPLPYSAASAEAFATASVGLLCALGCVDVLAFGAETPNASQMMDLANILQSPSFAPLLKKHLASGISFATARAAAAEELFAGAKTMLDTPNNILAIEYCKALQQPVPTFLQKAALAKGRRVPKLPIPMALCRQGAVHDGEPAQGFASASWLRAQVHAHGIGSLQNWVPKPCFALYNAAAKAGDVIDPARWDMALLARLKGKSREDFAQYSGAGEGLEARLDAAARKALTVGELYSLAKSKRFAHARVRRLALAAALGLPKAYSPVPPFVHILGAGKAGLSLLKTAKNTAVLPYSTSLAELAKTGALAAAMANTESACEDLYALCQTRPRAGGSIFTRPVNILP